MAVDSANDGTFDAVELTRVDGTIEKLTRAQFLAMRFHERVEAILQRRLRFLRAGVEVPMNLALKSY